MINIRPLLRTDYERWLPLWQENCLNNIADDMTKETWRRICHAKEPVYGLGAFLPPSPGLADTQPPSPPRGEGRGGEGVEGEGARLVGILHYVLHPTTGHLEPACYMQDLFVSPRERRQGIARQLVWKLEALGRDKGWSRIYWFAQHGNIEAQNLYKTLGIPMDFSLHMLSTKKA